MTELGIVGAGPVLELGEAGQVGALNGGHGVDWWVGAEDRWHIGSAEAAVRQAVADDGYTIETRLRVPGGDAVHSAVCVPSNGTSVAVVEITNSTPVPVAVALVLSTDAGEVVISGDAVSVDGRVMLRAGRSVARAFVADSFEDALVGVRDGAALPPAETVFPVRGSVVVAVFPLPHTAVLGCTVALEPLQELAAPQDLPPGPAVARGWERHVEGGAAVSVPDGRVMQCIAAARRHLLVGSGQSPTDPFWSRQCSGWAPAVGAAALGAWGHVAEGRELLLNASGTDDLVVHASREVDEAGSLLWAWAEHLERHPDPELEAAIGPWVQDVAVGLTRGGRRARRREQTGDAAWRAVGLAAAAALVSRLGEDGLGADIVDAIPRLIGEIDPAAGSVALALGGSRLGLESMVSLIALLEPDAGLNPFGRVSENGDQLGNLGRRGRRQHPEASALWLLALRRAVVDEPEGTGGPVALLSAVDQSWLGGSMEAHDVPVARGSASFGVRWHGERPALLWDIQAEAALFSVRAPGLDPAWSDNRPQGEALLCAAPGIVVEPGPLSAPVRPGEPLEVENDPDSFS